MVWHGEGQIVLGLWKKLLVFRGPRPARVSLRGGRGWIRQREPEEFQPRLCGEVEADVGQGSGGKIFAETTCMTIIMTPPLPPPLQSPATGMR